MPLRKYREFLLKNAAQISSVESTLRTLTYILPGRFADADLASEGLYTFINLASLYHDQILYDAAQKSGAELAPSLLNQYHRHWTASSRTMFWTSSALTLAQVCESFIEMCANKKLPRDKKWNLVMTIEAIKAVLRLISMIKTKRIGLHPTTPERDIDPQQLEDIKPTYRGPRTGISIPELPEGQSVSQFITAKAATSSYVSPLDLLSKLHGRRAGGEILFAIRPVLYVYLLKKYGRKSWLPFIVSFAAEALSYLLHHQNASKYTSRLEQAELGRRAGLFLWYALRSPLYDNATKGFFDAICLKLGTKPILRLFTAVIRDYQPLWENVYFYTSGS